MNHVPVMQFIAIGPPIAEHGAPVLVRSQNTGRMLWSTVRNYWFQNGKWHDEVLFYVGKMFDWRIDISPNYRYWYHSADRLYYAIVGEKRYRSLSKDRYECVFSPDSRFLAGVRLESRDAISLFEMPTGKKHTIKVSRALFFGWYPDSGRLWFGDGDVWFNLDIMSWQVRQISRSKAELLHRDWDLINPRNRHMRYLDNDPILHRSNSYYAYSPNCQVRLGTPPYFWTQPQRVKNEERIIWQPQTVWIEWRNGKKQKLWQNQQKGFRVQPCAVSNDGQFAIICLDEMDDNLTNVVESEWLVFAVPERKIVYRFKPETGRTRYYWYITSLHFGIGSILSQHVDI